VVVGYFIGKTKGRPGSGIIWAMVLGPIGWIVVLISPDLGPKCRECGGAIVRGARKCKNCGSSL
jgi:hypothetical protein